MTGYANFSRANVTRPVFGQGTVSVPSLRLAVIDGPYDVVTLGEILARRPIDLLNSDCVPGPGTACNHGTFIVGLLGARHDAPIPGLCPDCQLLHIPVFDGDISPSTSIEDVAWAVRLAVSAGAKLINLSLAILGGASRMHRQLAAALDYAHEQGAIIVVAAGNQRRSVEDDMLLTHAATVPVAAIDARGRLLRDCNFGPVITRRGIAVSGADVRGYAPGGRTTSMSGTSVAAAVATGILAQVWLDRPDATASEIRGGIAELGARLQSTPPLLDRQALLMLLDRNRSPRTSNPEVAQVSLQGRQTMGAESDASITSIGAHTPPPTPTRVAVPAGSLGDCTCAEAGGLCTCNKQSSRSGFVYAIGTIEAEYPNPAIEREMQILGRALGVEAEADAEVSMRMTEDRTWQHAVLSRDRKMTRYLARQLSWRLTIEEAPALVLHPTDPGDFDELIDCLARPKYPPTPRAQRGKQAKARPRPLPDPQDLDVIIGRVGASTEFGIDVAVDQVFTIKPEQLAPTGLGAYFGQVADNLGLTDEERAHNYLIARYEVPREEIDEITKDFDLAGVPSAYSRLSAANRRIVRVIYTFKGKNPNVPTTKKFFVRVDVTNNFPFIVTPWKRYLERGDEL